MSIKLLEQVYEGVILPSTEKALLAFLALRAHDDGTSIFPGVESMMQALCLKKCQTQKLLRNLREKGYLLQITHGGGSRNYVSYHIPLDASGTITPQPMAADLIAEQRAKYARKSKRADQAAAPSPASDEESQADDQADDEDGHAQKQLPASAPAPAGSADQARHFPAVAAALTTAIVPAPAPIPITPPPVESPPMTPEQQEQQEIQYEIAEWEEKINYYCLQRDIYPENSVNWRRWNKHYERAVDAQDQWKQLAIQSVAISPMEAPTGEYA